MEAKFYLKEVNEEYGLKGLTRPVTQLFFSLSRDHTGGGKTEFDNKATSEHVKNYPQEFEAFKVLNPDYVSLWEEKPIGVSLDKEFQAEKELQVEA